MSEDGPETAGGFGEFALIERLCAKLHPSFRRAEVIVGGGDDAAVLDAGGGRCWVVTCDVQVQGEHFPAEGVSGFDVGHKALAVNISDVAAMGGQPRYALLSLGVRRDTPLAFLDEVYEGLNAEADRWGVLVLGGNVTRTGGPFFIDVFLLGEVERENLLLRGGARVGDQILVTGFLGDAAAGLHLLSHPEVRVREETHRLLTSAHLRPRPRVEEARAVASLRLASAMIDISDALAGDLGHICRASGGAAPGGGTAPSGVGALVREDALPVSPAARELASAAEVDPAEWALYGGEDYQLLLTAPPAAVPALQEAVRAAAGVLLSPIGEIVPASEGLRLKRRGETVPLEARGWDHLRPPESPSSPS